ncbi:MAG: hypothetical protein J0I48_10670 [Devosia sp.]|uniref:nucleotidyltransferase domain-containing protein n=1 Tax=Devosia sp. 66-22 TaxID=1895753 RepID=UPI00092B2D89|nr:hypothetical protein [Devosia sp. 66-22]MBN9346644.1 hypothetical protein [Devosia sp.]OJX54702.1 MAG: hypothetical protein BGO81_16410 [Devosia sp. 66-22]
MSNRWRQTTPRELIDWLGAVDVPRAIAGGWALDLWQGAVTRPHSDIEIACFRADLHRLLPKLPAFEIVIARGKQLTPYAIGDALPDDSFSLWLRRRGETLWDFEIVVEEQRGGLWAYRREPAITRPVADVLTSAGGVPIIAPEIQLLYKCRDPRPKDVEDLRRCVPRLDARAYAWLHEAVARAHAGFLPDLEGMRR